MRKLPLFLLALPVIVSFNTAWGLDLSLNAYVNDRYYYRFSNEASAGRFQYDATISHDLVDSLNLAVTIWGSQRFDFRNGGVARPEETDYQAFLTFGTGDFSFCANASLYTFPISPSRCDLGLYAEYFVPTGLDMLGLAFHVACYWDLRGLYQEIKVTPSLSLPLGGGISLSIPVIIGIAENGYNGLVSDGLTGIAIDPRLVYLVSDIISIGVSGGYFFSLSDGVSSYPHVGVKVGFYFNG